MDDNCLQDAEERLAATDNPQRRYQAPALRQLGLAVASGKPNVGTEFLTKTGPS